MGENKLPLELGATPLVSRVYRVLEPICGEVLVAGGGDAASLPPRARRVPDLRQGALGPLAGIEAGLRAARYRHVFVAAGDMPFLSEDLVRSLLGLLTQRPVPAAVPYWGERLHPLCAAYDRDAVLPEVEAALDRGVRAVRAVVEGLAGAVYVEEGRLRAFGAPERLLMNVNTPEDFSRARAMLRDGP